jgi:DNA-binding response OmpR family regulator
VGSGKLEVGIDVDDGLDLGANDYVVKPFDPREVAAHVPRYMST